MKYKLRKVVHNLITAHRKFWPLNVSTYKENVRYDTRDSHSSNKTIRFIAMQNYIDSIIPIRNMSKNEVNEYVNTFKPILYLLKINGVLPIQLERKNNLTWYVISKITALVAICVYMGTVISNSIYVFRQVNKLIDKFNLDHLLVISAPVTARIFIFTIPFTTWGKSKHLHDYWNNWKRFQDEYESISETTFVSPMKKNIRIAAATALLLTISTLILAQCVYYKGTVNVNFVSVCFLFSTINSIAAYWFTNCIYMRSVANGVLNLVQKIIEDGYDDGKMNRLTVLWLMLCELVDQFNTSHSILFLAYLLLVIILCIVSFYSGATSMIFHIRSFVYIIRFVTCGVGILMIMVFCETAYSLYKQINKKQEEMLLQEHTITMKPRMLNAVWGFLQTIQTRNPQLNLNGFLILNRSLFPSIVSASINYLIILRQFALKK